MSTQIEQQGKRTMPEGNRGNKISFKSTKKGQLLPLKGAMTLLGVGRSRTYDIVKLRNLPAWVWNKDGTELIPYDPKTTAEQNIFVYQGDIDKYLELKSKKQSHARTPKAVPPYGQAEIDAIDRVAQEQIEERGYVSRTDIMKTLGWNSHKFPIIRDVAEKKNYPMKFDAMSRYRRGTANQETEE